MSLARILGDLLRPSVSTLPLAEVMELVSATLDANGLPVDRMSWSVPMLHPDVRAVQVIWRRGRAVESIERAWIENLGGFDRSPIGALMRGDAAVLRERVSPTGGPRRWPVLDELAAQGFTDYLVALEPAADPFERGAVSWATRAPGGWSDEQIEILLGLLPAVTLFLRLDGHRRRGQGLLATYLGEDAALRVLEGRIRRGELVEIDAAITFCDIRGFTAASAEMSGAELVAMLDDTFDIVVEAVQAEGGDVLKFIGDAVLAVFRDEPTRAAERALRAAEATEARLTAWSDNREAAGLRRVEVGFGLHIGRASYGNVGGARRLDFTVIGRDVNIASRVEGLCRPLAARLVATEAFVRALGAPVLEDGGVHTLKGVPDPVRVYVRR
jgi:adenylate cyclase